MQNPIRAAVAPLKYEAVARAAQDAAAMIDRFAAIMDSVDWDLNVAAPRPVANRMGRAEYAAAQARREMLQYLFPYASSVRLVGPRNMNSPMYLARTAERDAKVIADAQEDAAAAYEAFIAKLESKVGETVAATLEGSHVWGSSILTVTLPNGTVERWKTTQIVNVSKLGKLFNQWPSRKVK